MDTNSNKNTTHPDNEQQEIRYASYILRIWRTEDGNFKGYILNPITRQTYPIENITKSISSVDPPLSGGVVLQPIGCKLGLWDPIHDAEETDQLTS